MHKARWRCRARIATVIVTGLLNVAHGVAAETSISRNRGANITVTAPAAFNRMAFDLAGQIWLTGDALEPATPLTESGALHQRPAFSRDGRLIAYESLLAGYHQIFIADLESGVTRQVTFGPYDHLAPAWSPTSFPHSRLVMSSNRSSTFAIWEVNIDNLELRQLTFPCLCSGLGGWLVTLYFVSRRQSAARATCTRTADCTGMATRRWPADLHATERTLQPTTHADPVGTADHQTDHSARTSVATPRTLARPRRLPVCGRRQNPAPDAGPADV